MARRRNRKNRDMRKYIPHPFDYYALLFFAAALAGWLWEVLLYLAVEHTFVNRGVCRGPYLPVYGIGGVLLMLMLWRLRGHPFRVFAISCLSCSILEYLSGRWLEWRWGARWWDYSGRLLEIDGHVCLMSAAAFGACGVLLICTIQPLFNRIYHHMTIGMRAALCILCVLTFTADAAYSALIPNTGPNICS